MGMTNQTQTPTLDEAKEQIDDIQDAVEFVENYAEGTEERQHKEDDNRKLEYNLCHTQKKKSEIYFVLLEKKNGDIMEHYVTGVEWEIKD